MHVFLYFWDLSSDRNGFGMLVPQDLVSEALLSSPLSPACKNGSLRKQARRRDKAVELEATSGSTAAVFWTPGTSCPEATVPTASLRAGLVCPATFQAFSRCRHLILRKDS